MIKIVHSIAQFTFLEVTRNRFIWLIVVALGGALGVAEFLSDVALSETERFQSAVLGALLRASAVFLVALFVVTSLTRELNDKGLEMLLALPIPRGAFLAGKLLGFGAATLVLTTLFGLAAAVHTPAEQALIWSISLFLELLLIAGLSVLCLFTFSQVPAAIATVLGFYVLARTIAALQLIGHGPMQIDPSIAQSAAVHVIDAIAWLLPELHHFTRTDWLVYHSATWSDLLPVAGQSAIYMAVIVGAAAFDLHRKNL